jgi:hypothetical protein
LTESGSRHPLADTYYCPNPLPRADDEETSVASVKDTARLKSIGAGRTAECIAFLFRLFFLVIR